MSISERADEHTDSSGPVGVQLRKARTDQGLSIEDMCQRTNIRPAVVHALENGDLETSGGAVYARGHVRTLAHALGVDADRLLAHFDASYGAAMPTTPVLNPEPAADPPSAKVTRRTPRAPDSSGPVTGASRKPRWSWIMAAALVVVIIIALVQLLLPEGKSSPSQVKAAVPSAAAVKKVPRSKPTAPSLIFPVPGEGVTLRIVLSKPSWLEISDEHGVSLIKRVAQPSSEPIDLHAAAGINATFGDASAVSLSCNGRPTGPIGTPGQVITLIFNRGSAFCPGA